MPDSERIARGLRFEKRVRDALGGRLQPGSGNGWRNKGDVKAALLISCKAEADQGKTWGKIRRQLFDTIDMTFGTGLAPALALLEDDGQEIVVMRLSDLCQVLDGSAQFTGERNKGDKRRAAVDVPAVLRED